MNFFDMDVLIIIVGIWAHIENKKKSYKLSLYIIVFFLLLNNLCELINKLTTLKIK